MKLLFESFRKFLDEDVGGFTAEFPELKQAMMDFTAALQTAGYNVQYPSRAQSL
jgi:hypothetical protein